MKRSLLLAVLWFHSMTWCTSQVWHFPGYLPGALRYDDVFFIDSITGWTINGDGGVFKTYNGGKNWETLFNTYRYNRCVEFINSKIGFVGTLKDKFYRTEDGGYTWDSIEQLIPHPIPGVCGLSHVGNSIFGVGVYYEPAFFIKSTDQGLNWTYLDMSPYASGLVDCYFVNENVGFVSGMNYPNGGVILKTVDGGLTWKQAHITLHAFEYVWKMFFVTNELIYASIESFVGASRILKSTDAGEHWTEYVVSSKDLDLEGIGFINQDTGWVCPRDEYPFETHDGGHSWTQTFHFWNINRYQKINDGLMYASGNAVLKYSDTTSTIPLEPLPKDHDFIEATPNPFTDEILIKIRVDKQTHVRLDLIAMDGTFISSLFNGYLDKGTYPFKYKSEPLGFLYPGTYVLAMRTNERFLSKKIIKGF